MLINGMLTNKKNHMQVWGNLVDEVSKKGRRLDLRDPIRWFKYFCRFPECSLGTDPHRQTAQDGCRVAPHGAMEAIKLLMSLMETTFKKKKKKGTKSKHCRSRWLWDMKRTEPHATAHVDADCWHKTRERGKGNIFTVSHLTPCSTE